MDASYAFAESFVHTKFEDLPRDAVEVTRREILDILGVALGGSGKPGVRELLELYTGWGGKEESTVFCYGNRMPAPNAAQVNASMSHALDYDDTGAGPVHPSVAIVPACLALAERKGGLSGRELITAVALGVDMMCRLGLGFRRVMETMPPEIRESLPGKTQPAAGWHLTPLYAFIASAGAAGRVIGLDEERMLNALGIGYHQSAGNGQCVLDGAMTKRMGPGFASRGGVMAALMAEKGITGAPNIFQGEDGLYPVYHRNTIEPEFLTAGLGKRFEGVNVTMKPYPCCAGTHGFVGATFTLVEKHGIKAGDVSEIVITSRKGDVLCVPLEVRSRPRNPVDSQFSVPWAVAAVVARSRAGIGEFNDEAIRSADILEVSGKIKLDEISDTPVRGGTNPLKVEIRMKDGRVYSENTGSPMGEGGILPYADYERKFRDCASYSAMPVPAKNLDRVVEMVGRLEELEDVTEIIKLVS